MNPKEPVLFKELDPEPRLLMGPGSVDVHPRVLRAMSMPMQGRFDPQFTQYMNEVQVLYRQVFQTRNQQTFLIDGNALAAIQASLVSVIEKGDKVLVPIFGSFGHLLKEIAQRAGASVVTIDAQWGTVFTPEQIECAVATHKPKLVAISQGDTSTTMKQPLQALSEICHYHGTLVYVDATASAGGNALPVDEWGLDMVSIGLQKCLSGPPGSAPITFSDDVAERIRHRKHTDAGIRAADVDERAGSIIQSNYFDLGMLMDYWSPLRLNHHTDSVTMLYAARECARVLLEEGAAQCQARHRLTSRAMRAGLEAMRLKLFGDADYRLDNVTGVFIPKVCGDGAALRAELLNDFGIEIGTSSGPLDGKIWRIGTMGYGCRKSNVMRCLSALEMTLHRQGHRTKQGAGVDAAFSVYDAEDAASAA